MQISKSSPTRENTDCLWCGYVWCACLEVMFSTGPELLQLLTTPSPQLIMELKEVEGHDRLCTDGCRVCHACCCLLHQLRSTSGSHYWWLQYQYLVSRADQHQVGWRPTAVARGKASFTGCSGSKFKQLVSLHHKKGQCLPFTQPPDANMKFCKRAKS